MTSIEQRHYLTSPHNQPHYIQYFISPGNHDIIPRNITSQHITSPPPTHHGNTTSHYQNTTTKRNGWWLAHTKNSVWAARWLVALRAFCRQILSLAYRFCPPETSAPGLSGIMSQISTLKRLLVVHFVSGLIWICPKPGPLRQKEALLVS